MQLQATVHVCTCHLHLAVQFRQQELRVLHGGNGLTEGLAFLRVLDGPAQRCLCHGNRTDGHAEALLGQVVHQVHEAHAGFAQHVLGRNFHVVEEQLGRVLCVHAQFVEVAATFETLHPALQHDEGEPAVAGFGVGATDRQDKVGVDAVRDEGLRAVHHVRVALLHRRGLGSCHVASGVRFRDGNGGDVLARHHLRQPARLLVGVRERQVVRQDDVVVQGHAVGGTDDTRVTDFFLHDGTELVVIDATAAVLLGHVIPEEAVLARLQPDLARGDSVLLPLFVVRHHFLVEPTAECRPELLVVGVVDVAFEEIHVANLRQHRAGH